MAGEREAWHSCVSRVRGAFTAQLLLPWALSKQGNSCPSYSWGLSITCVSLTVLGQYPCRGGAHLWMGQEVAEVRVSVMCVW